MTFAARAQSASAPPGFDCTGLLRRHGLRPTKQRVMLAHLLFGGGGRHLTAEMLYAEAGANGMRMSLATVYNTLHQFTRAGMLRQIGVDGSRSFFDTNPGCHHHFFVAGEDRLFDTPAPGVVVERVPAPLPGYEIAGIDVLIHLRRRTA